MNKDYVVMRLKRLIQDELDVCEKAIRVGDVDQAAAKVAEASKKVRQLIRELG